MMLRKMEVKSKPCHVKSETVFWDHSLTVQVNQVLHIWEHVVMQMVCMSCKSRVEVNEQSNTRIQLPVTVESETV
jgi:hypothetical protein